MRWRKLERSKNVEDRRGVGGKAAAGVGGLGIIGVLIALGFYMPFFIALMFLWFRPQGLFPPAGAR